MFSRISILFLVSVTITQQRTITFKNRCVKTIWINPLTSDNGTQLANGIQRLDQNARVTYNIPSSGWKGQFWPKTDCDSSGNNCGVGQSVYPCTSTGCQPPSDTKIQLFFPSISAKSNIWYEFSLLDSYSSAMEIIPNKQGGSCARTNCAVSLDSCPMNEKHVGDLRVVQNGSVVQCLSPCKKLISPDPYGLGHSEESSTGQQFCCTTPPVTPELCRGGEVVSTQYVSIIKRDCPTAYSFPYDNDLGFHNCPNPTNFNINVC